MNILRILTPLLPSIFSSTSQTEKNQKSNPGNSESDPTQVVMDLRNQIFTLSPAEMSLVPSDDLPNTWGAVTEIGYPETFISLVTLADGTTSLYFGQGGGIIGGGGHEEFRRTSNILLGGYEYHLEQMVPTSSYPVPEAGRVKFYALTYSGFHSIDVSEHELREGTHELSLLFKAAHGVITELRILDQQNQ